MQRSNLSGDEYAEAMSLYARYNHASDTDNVEIFASCFTDRASLINEHAGFVATGRDELMALKRKAHTPPGEYRRHWNNNIYLEKAASDLISGRCYLLVFGGKLGDPPRIIICGTYTDELTLTHNEWKFSKRRLFIDWGQF